MDSDREIQARWVVDASGRNTLLQRQLGLAKKVDIRQCRLVPRRLIPSMSMQWSTDPEWQARIQRGRASLSTNHLMGPGYWVWLIPPGVWLNQRWHRHRCEHTSF